MTSLSEIRSAYTEEKRALDKGSNIWIYLVIRRLSFYPTWVCLKLGISANQATFVSIVVGILGCLFLAAGGYVNSVIGALLVNGWSLLDCVDGNLARLTKSYSKYGWFLDSITGFMMNAFLLVSVGIGVFNRPDGVIHSLATMFPVDSQAPIGSVFLILGAGGSLAAMFYALVLQLFENGFSQSLLGGGATIWSRDGFYSVILAMGKYVTGFGLIEPMLLLAALFNYLSLLTGFFALANIGAAGFVTIKAVRKAKEIG